MKINLDVRIDQKINVDVDIYEVIKCINEAEMKRRWNFISQIINEVELSAKELTDEQKEIVKNYLKNRLLIFDPCTT